MPVMSFRLAGSDSAPIGLAIGASRGWILCVNGVLGIVDNPYACYYDRVL